MFRKVLFVLFILVHSHVALGQTVTTFQLTPGVSGTLPFMVGLGFRKGDVPNFPTTNATTSQVIIKSRWNDNSVKHAIASGTQVLTNGSPTTITVSNTTSAPTGTNLTCADITAAAPSASIQAGAIGTVNLSSLFASPFRTWISGPEMVECHYRSAVGSDPTLVAWFHVRRWANGRIWIRVVVKNGYLDVSTGDKTYVPTVTIGGSVVYDNSGASLTHYAHTRWTAEGWVGTDPAITVAHDTTYLQSTKLVPNYWKKTPGSTTLNGLNQTYAPMNTGSWDVDQTGTGDRKFIGPLPQWDALYLTSNGDARAFRSVIANAKGGSTYPLVWDDSATNVTPLPSSRPTWSVNGSGGSGNTIWFVGPLVWDMSHHGSLGYLAYLITGDYFFYELIQDQSAMVYLMNDIALGTGTSRLFGGQTRSVAWAARDVGQYVGISPTSDPVAADYRSLLAYQATYWNNVRTQSGMNTIGFLFSYELAINWPSGTDQGMASAWMQAYWSQSYGLVHDMEPFSDMTAWDAVRNFVYKSTVGITGPNGVDNYCFTKSGGQYAIKISDFGNNQDPKLWYDSWGTVFEQTHGTPNTSCGNTLEGGSGGDPSIAPSGFWGYYLPSIAYAVDHGATGALAAWGRLTGATNWSVLENSGFDDDPKWGVVPRSIPPDTGWWKFPSSHMTPQCPPNNFGGSGVAFADLCYKIVDEWGGGTFDSTRNRLLINGGGHGGYPGNEVYALDFDTGIFSRLSDPGLPIATHPPCVDSIVGGTQPNARHTYDGIEYMPNVDKMLIFSGSLYCGSGDYHSDTWLFNLANNTWAATSPSGTIPRGGPEINTAYDSNTGKVFLHDVWELSSYDPNTNTWTQLSNNFLAGSQITTYMVGVIDPVRKRYILIGNGMAWYYSIAAGSTYIKTALPMTGATTLRDAAAPGLAYDSQNDQIVGWFGSDTIYKLNLTNLTWTTATFTGGPPLNAGACSGNGCVFGKWVYSPTSGVFAVLTDANKDVSTLRITPATGAPPPITGTLRIRAKLPD